MAEVLGKAEVIALLRERGVDFDVVEHEAVYTMEGMRLRCRSRMRW